MQRCFNVQCNSTSSWQNLSITSARHTRTSKSHLTSFPPDGMRRSLGAPSGNRPEMTIADTLGLIGRILPFSPALNLSDFCVSQSIRGSPSRRSCRRSERRMVPVTPVGPIRLGVVDCGGGGAAGCDVVVSSTVVVVVPSEWVVVVVVVVVSALLVAPASNPHQKVADRRQHAP